MSGAQLMIHVGDISDRKRRDSMKDRRESHESELNRSKGDPPHVARLEDARPLGTRFLSYRIGIDLSAAATALGSGGRYLPAKCRRRSDQSSRM